MTEQLKDWLVKSVAADLEDVLHDRLPRRKDDAGESWFEGDSDGLHVRCKHIPRIIQVMHFRAPRDSLASAVLSDSHTSIHARFTKDSVKRHLERSPSQGHVPVINGHVVLSDFDIYVSFIGDPDQRVTLLVRDFALKGTKTSHTHQPKLLVERSLVKDVLAKLQSNFKRRPQHTANELGSQVSSNASSTQVRASLATQALPGHAPNTAKFSQPVRVGGINLSGPREARRHVAENDTGPSEEERLLALLNQPKKAFNQATTQAGNDPVRDLEIIEEPNLPTSDYVFPGTTSLHNGNFRFTRLLPKDLRVPADQARILERSDSWQRPEPGVTRPALNVPNHVLVALRSAHQRESSTANQQVGPPAPVNLTQSQPANASDGRVQHEIISTSDSDEDEAEALSWEESDYEVEQEEKDQLPLDSSQVSLPSRNSLPALHDEIVHGRVRKVVADKELLDDYLTDADVLLSQTVRGANVSTRIESILNCQTSNRENEAPEAEGPSMQSGSGTQFQHVAAAAVGIVDPEVEGHAQTRSSAINVSADHGLNEPGQRSRDNPLEEDRQRKSPTTAHTVVDLAGSPRPEPPSQKARKGSKPGQITYSSIPSIASSLQKRQTPLNSPEAAERPVKRPKIVSEGGNGEEPLHPAELYQKSRREWLAERHASKAQAAPAQNVVEVRRASQEHTGQARTDSKSSASRSAGITPERTALLRPGNGSDGLYERFRDAYPVYKGDMKHFLRRCEAIEKLHAQRSLPRMLWDDYLIRHKTDYMPYAAQCAEEGEGARPYNDYYDEEFEEPLHTKKLLNPQSLGEVILVTDRPSTSNIARSAASTPSVIRSTAPPEKVLMVEDSPPLPARSSPHGDSIGSSARRRADTYRPSDSSPLRSSRDSHPLSWYGSGPRTSARTPLRRALDREDRRHSSIQSSPYDSARRSSGFGATQASERDHQLSSPIPSRSQDLPRETQASTTHISSTPIKSRVAPSSIATTSVKPATAPANSQRTPDPFRSLPGLEQCNSTHLTTQDLQLTLNPDRSSLSLPDLQLQELQRSRQSLRSQDNQSQSSLRSQQIYPSQQDQTLQSQQSQILQAQQNPLPGQSTDTTAVSPEITRTGIYTTDETLGSPDPATAEPLVVVDEAGPGIGEDAAEENKEAAEGEAWWKTDNTAFKEFVKSYNGLKAFGGDLARLGGHGRVDVLAWDID